jgi:bacteriorhodopsin
MDSINFSTNLSIFIQLLSVVGLEGIFINLPTRHRILQSILKLEMIVQFIELFFYILILKPMIKSSLNHMAAARYIDWIVTTPTMLLTLIILFKYEEHLENNIDEEIDFYDFLKTNRNNIMSIFLFNFLMLFFGYLGEIGVIDLKLSTTLGFIFLGLTFYIIYKDYAVKSKKAKKLFYYMFTIWSIYGIAALMEPTAKNNMFNILDIFAKNFMGLYIYYRIKKVNTTNNFL